MANPIAVKIKSMVFVKNLGQEPVDISPQMIELNVYTSIFQTSMKADLLINDPVGLFFNYPLLGEEFIRIIWEDTKEIGEESAERHMDFMINSAKAITIRDTTKGQMYVLELYSGEVRTNARTWTQKAYNESYHTVLYKLLKNELRVDDRKLQEWNVSRLDAPDGRVESSQGIHHFIIPNLHPLEACTWLCKRAVAQDTNHNTLFFFEDLNGYNFVSYEKLRDTPRPIKKYIYLSNITEAIRTQTLQGLGIPEHNILTALEINKRWNTLEKIIAGYFDNAYVEIDITNLQLRKTPHLLAKYADEKNFLNTDQYISMAQTHGSNDHYNRERYTITQGQGDDPTDDQYWRNKYGPVTQTITGLNQLHLTMAAPGDTRLNVGDIIDLSIPEFHGFTRQVDDHLVSGRFLVLDKKDSITIGGSHIMVLNIARSDYENPIPTRMIYDVGK